MINGNLPLYMAKTVNHKELYSNKTKSAEITIPCNRLRRNLCNVVCYMVMLIKLYQEVCTCNSAWTACYNKHLLLIFCLDIFTCNMTTCIAHYVQHSLEKGHDRLLIMSCSLLISVKYVINVPGVCCSYLQYGHLFTFRWDFVVKYAIHRHKKLFPSYNDVKIWTVTNSCISST